MGLELVPDVFGRRHESAENDADEQDHEDAADVLQVELAHRRRALVLLQGAIKVLLRLKGSKGTGVTQWLSSKRDKVIF